MRKTLLTTMLYTMLTYTVHHADHRAAVEDLDSSDVWTVWVVAPAQTELLKKSAISFDLETCWEIWYIYNPFRNMLCCRIKLRQKIVVAKKEVYEKKGHAKEMLGTHLSHFTHGFPTGNDFLLQLYDYYNGTRVLEQFSVICWWLSSLLLAP